MKIQIILIAILAMTLAKSCTNNQESDLPQPDKNQEFDSPIELTKIESQYFEINPQRDTVLVGQKGTRLILKAESFTVNTDNIKIELKECYSLGDMIMEGLVTLSDGTLIETDGMIYIEATSMSGDHIDIAPNQNCIIEMPATNFDMNLFYGEDSGSFMNWKEDSSQNSLVDNSIPDTASTVLDERYNIFNATKLGWINADKFIEVVDKTDLFVTLPENQTGAVYSLAFYNYNSILPGIPNDKGVLEFKGIPSNEKVTLIGIGSKGEKLYYSVLDLTTDTKNAKLSSLKEISKEKLQTELENKFGKSLANRHKPSF